MKSTFVKSLILCSLFAVSMGLQAKFKLVNATDSKIEFMFATPEYAKSGKKVVTSILAPGASWDSSESVGPDRLSVARYGVGSSLSRWNEIDCDAKIKEIYSEKSRNPKATVLWNIVPTLFGYDVEIDWEKGNGLGTFE